ncbi:MAG TPA: hypothetical protein DCQ32_00875 [Cyanobacteria bacterium UBA8156]|nr:hypothetical protein [Cyanobacteria bacterium UBA8156]
MAVLIASTLRRLQRLPRTAAVWEGDCRPLPTTLIPEVITPEVTAAAPPCLLWVDSSAEMVRALLFVGVVTAREAFVQGLIQAMERPQSPALPGLPAKILVRDRALQLFLQEVLQGLAIRVEYASYLPLIDEIFVNLSLPTDTAPATVPDTCAVVIQQQVAALQRLAPWETVPLWRVVELTLALPSGTETLYGTVVRSEEQGVLFFRSATELLSYYQRLATAASWQDLEAALQTQNCWFVVLGEAETGMTAAMHFGSRHPLEGERYHLDEDEAAVLAMAVGGAVAFFGASPEQMAGGLLTILPLGTTTVSIQARPAVALESSLREWLRPLETTTTDWRAVPPLVTLQEMSRPQIEVLRGSRRCRQQRDTFPLALPLLLWQMPREPAEAAIQEITAVGGLLGLGFYHPPNSGRYLSVIVMANGERLGSAPLPQETAQILRWQRSAVRSGYSCAVAIAVGGRSRSRYNPELRQILAYYEVSLLQLADSQAPLPVSF